MPTFQEIVEKALGHRYAVQGELGTGGMATVFLAHDHERNGQVALKVFRPELASVVGADRFLREVDISAKMDHPSIPAVYDSGDVGGVLYYSMPVIRGEALGDRLEREEVMPLEETLKIADDVASALHYAHETGLVHRDIKPDNIMLTQGHAIVMDFGIARAITAAGGPRLTETGLIIGTPIYMSPEQAAGDKELDKRSDIYSFGCVVHEMLSGAPPFTGPNAQVVMARHALEDPPLIRTIRPEVPEHVEAAIRRAMKKDPDDRFSSAERFGDALAGRGPVEDPEPPTRTSRISDAFRTMFRRSE